MLWVNTDGTQEQGVGPISSPLVRSGTGDLTGGAGQGGAGLPVYAMDGTTSIARNNADIYNGWSNPFDGDNTLRLASGSTNNDSDGNPVTASQAVHYSPFLDQFGLGDTATVHGADAWTGGSGSHVNAAGDTPSEVRTSHGSSNANNSGRVWNRFNRNNVDSKSLYVLSAPLTVMTGGGAPFHLTITANGANYDFSWDSQDGKLYDLMSSTDLSTPPADWPVYEGNTNIDGTARENSLPVVSPSGPRRFFAVVEKDPPPLLSENFDTVAALPAGWSSTGPSNGTNIGGYYTENADLSLVSPSFAVPAGSGATLGFQQFIDTDLAGVPHDFGSVRVLDADNADTPIAGLEIIDIEGDGLAGWTGQTLNLPSADVGGKNIKIEFRFASNAGTVQATDVFSGFYVDDVEVIENAP